MKNAIKSVLSGLIGTNKTASTPEPQAPVEEVLQDIPNPKFVISFSPETLTKLDD